MKRKNIQSTTIVFLVLSAIVFNPAISCYKQNRPQTSQTVTITMTNESKVPRTKMLLVYVGATDSCNQPKIKYNTKTINCKADTT